MATSVDSGWRQLSCTSTADIEGTARLIASESALAWANSATRMPRAEDCINEHAVRIECTALATNLSNSAKLLLLLLPPPLPPLLLHPLRDDQSTRKSRLRWSSAARGARSLSTTTSLVPS